MHETQMNIIAQHGGIISILHLPGRCPNGPGHATWHQTCSLYHCLLSTDFDLNNSGPVPDLLTATETSSSHSPLLSQRRGLVNAELP